MVLKKSPSIVKAPCGGKARDDCGQFMYELKLVPFKAQTFSAASYGPTGLGVELPVPDPGTGKDAIERGVLGTPVEFALDFFR
jgi:hypothetical protein